MHLFPLVDGPPAHWNGANNVDAKAVIEMLGGAEGLKARWTRAPNLRVLVSVMEYKSGKDVHYVATGEQLSTKEVDALVADLSEGLRLLTANTFEGFAEVQREAVAPGATAPISQLNSIVVGRFNGVQKALGTVGIGGREARADGTIRAGAILLDSDYDRTSPKRRLLRTHELGHALGYNHVRSRESIMNARIGSEPNAFDRGAVLLAFRPAAFTSAAR
jgi:hypothetical protein